MKREEVRRIACEAFDRLVRDVEAGRSESLREYLRAMGRFHNYSLGNAISIQMQRPGATHVAGFWTWKRLGRRVKKGEHGIAIMAPVVYRQRAAVTDDEDGDEDEIVRTFKTAYVFDVSQTEGRPLPEFAQARGDPGVYLDRLERFVSERGIKLERTGALVRAEGVSTGGTILLKQCLSPAGEFSVMVHELAHELLHQGEQDAASDRKTKETEAEAVAYVVCQGVGLDTNTASCDYIQLYQDQGDRKTLMQSLERIQRTASQILEAITREDDNEMDMAIAPAQAAIAA